MGEVSLWQEFPFFNSKMLWSSPCSWWHVRGHEQALASIFDLLPLCSMTSGKPPPSASAFLQNLETIIISSIMHITIARKILLLCNATYKISSGKKIYSHVFLDLSLRQHWENKHKVSDSTYWKQHSLPFTIYIFLISLAFFINKKFTSILWLAFWIRRL